MNNRGLETEAALAIDYINNLVEKIESLESIIEDCEKQIESLEKRLENSENECYELNIEIKRLI